MTALMYAAQGGHFEVAKLLIEKGAEVNKQYRMTELMYATQGGHFEVAKLLVEKGADVNKQKFDVRTDNNIINCFMDNGAHCGNM
jgi:ankyrin repeat protein